MNTPNFPMTSSQSSRSSKRAVVSLSIGWLYWSQAIEIMLSRVWRVASPILKQASDYVEIGLLYIDNQFVAPPPFDYSNENKAQAELLLQATDWTQITDVLLLNKNEFIDYRSQLRTIALNPPVEVTEWPVKPEEVW